MPPQIRKIKYHPAADLTKPSIILKSAYINILQNMKKAIRKSNLTRSSQELTKTAHSCQIKLNNTLERLRKERNLLKKEKVLVQPLTELFQLFTIPSPFQGPRIEKTIDSALQNFRRMRQPSSTFFKLIELLNQLLEAQDKLYRTSMDARKSYQLLQKGLNSLKRRTPLTDSLNELLPPLRIYLDEVAKFSKTTKPSTHLKAILKNANKLKYISGQYEKGQI